MVKSVVYYYVLRIYVLAVWHSPDGSGICSPYTGDRDPQSAHIISYLESYFEKRSKLITQNWTKQTLILLVKSFP